jgi:hypothetical protein
VLVAIFEAPRPRYIGSPWPWAAKSVRIMTVGVSQDLPMGALTVTFAVRRYNIPDTVVLSLVTSSVMLGMKLAQLNMLKHWYTAQSQLCATAIPSFRRIGCRWDKVSHWKAKLSDDEMIEAGPALAIHAATRARVDVEAELGIVARLLSGLPTHVHAGEYAAALEAHLASNSDALQQELHRNVQASASGTTGAPVCVGTPGVLTGYYTGTHPKPTVRRVRPARARALQDAVAAHCTIRAEPCLRTRALQPPGALVRTTSPARPSRAGPRLLLYGPASYPAGSTAPAAPPCTLGMPATVLRTRMPGGSATALCGGVARSCRSRNGLAARDGSKPCPISSVVASGRRQRRSWLWLMPQSHLGIARLAFKLAARCAGSARPLLYTRSSRARRCAEGAASGTEGAQ